MRTRLFSPFKPFLFTPLLMGWVTTATADEAKTFADIANNLIFGANVLTDFLHATCILIGVGFMIYSVVSYRNHRLNPKMVPLDRPVVYLLLGLVLAALPFLGYILEHATGETHVHRHHSHRPSIYYDHDIDEPLE